MDEACNTAADESPVLTVSIAAYNSEEYLGRCLGSCSGFRGRLQVIIVDDGSTDGTAAIADSYAEADPSTFVVIHKENGNYGSTINASLPLAAGKYYRLLDSDDWFDGDSLSRWLDVLAGSDSDAACTSSIRVMQESGREILMDPWPEVIPGDYDLESLNVDRVPGPGMSNLVYRTAFLKGMGLSFVEGCSYVDEEFRCVPWCHVETVRVDHIPVYRVLKERSDQSTGLEGIRRHCEDKRRIFSHMVESADFGAPGSRTKAQTMALQEVAVGVVAGYYRNKLLLPPSRETLKELIDFDDMLKAEYGEIYALTNSSCFIRALRLSRFALYRPLSFRAIHRWSY